MFRHMHRFCIWLKESYVTFRFYLIIIKMFIHFLSQSCVFNGYLIQLTFFTSKNIPARRPMSKAKVRRVRETLHEVLLARRIHLLCEHLAHLAHLTHLAHLAQCVSCWLCTLHGVFSMRNAICGTFRTTNTLVVWTLRAVRFNKTRKTLVVCALSAWPFSSYESTH